MDAYTNAVLGIMFLSLAFAAVFLMFKIWGSFQRKGTSAALPDPSWLSSRTCWSAWSTTVSKSPPRGRKRSRGT